MFICVVNGFFCYNCYAYDVLRFKFKENKVLKMMCTNCYCLLD